MCAVHSLQRIDGIVTHGRVTQLFDVVFCWPVEGQYLTFVVVWPWWGGRGHLILPLLLAFLLCQVGVGIVVAQPRTVLVALPTDC